MKLHMDKDWVKKFEDLEDACGGVMACSPKLRLESEIDFLMNLGKATIEREAAKHIIGTIVTEFCSADGDLDRYLWSLGRVKQLIKNGDMNQAFPDLNFDDLPLLRDALITKNVLGSLKSTS